jgi:hypothetical protein
MKKSIAHVLAIALSSALVLVFVATSSAAWKPIIGIPNPSFGIDEIAPALPNP